MSEQLHHAIKENTNLNLEIFTSADAFEKLKSEWNELVEASVTNTIFLTWEWQKHWWDAYQNGELWIITCRDGDQLVGIAPMFKTEYEGQQMVRCIGAEDVTDYLDLIVHADYRESVYEAFAQVICDNTSDFDTFELVNLIEKSPTRTVFANILNTHGFELSETVRDVCPIIELNGSWDDYLENLDKKQRHELRRKLRHAEGQKMMGGLEWYIVTEEHDIQAEIEKFTQLMASSQQDKHEFLQNEAHHKFFQSMIPAMLEKGWLQLNFLVINETQHVAAYLNFVYNKRVYVYNSGLDHEQFPRLSPGIILLCYNIQYAIDNGYSVFDFLRGNETYKYRMGAHDTEIYRLMAQIAE